MDMYGEGSSLYLARAPCVPFLLASSNSSGTRRAFRSPGEGGDHFHCTAEGIFARSYSVMTGIGGVQRELSDERTEMPKANGRRQVERVDSEQQEQQAHEGPLGQLSTAEHAALQAALPLELGSTRRKPDTRLPSHSFSQADVNISKNQLAKKHLVENAHVSFETDHSVYDLTVRAGF